MKVHLNIIVSVTIVVITLILLSLVQEASRGLQIKSEIQKLETQARQLETNVIELEQLNQYFRTNDYQERLAREKLNFHSPGEQVVLIPEDEIQSLELQTREEVTPDRPSNALQWWNMFFVAGQE